MFKRKKNDSAIEDSPVEGAKDVDEDIIQTGQDDKIIPMGDNSVQEHDEKFKDF